MCIRDRIIADASMEAEEIDYFLLHQANDRMLDKMSKKLGVSREKIPANKMCIRDRYRG